MIYLDNAATTKPFPEVLQRQMDIAGEIFANPSSLHGLGVKASEYLEQMRQKVADFLGLSPSWILFTGGATEANSMVLQGGIKAPNPRNKHLLISSFEHACIREQIPMLKERGYELEELVPDKHGLISPAYLKKQLKSHTGFVSIIGIHNELGVIQDIAGLKAVIKEHNPKCLFHVDAVQMFGKCPLPEPDDMPDFLSGSAHKFHGPHGVGFLVKNPKVHLKPIIHGGGQEMGLRSGTENLPGIAGAALALELCQHSKIYGKAVQWQKQIFELCSDPENKFRWLGPEPGPQRSPWICTLCLPGIKSEVFIHTMEEFGFYVSSGSACSEKQKKRSPLAKVLELDPQEAEGIVRISFGHLNTDEDVELLKKTLLVDTAIKSRYDE